MNTFTKLAAVALTFGMATAAPAYAGKGGSAGLIQAAISSTSVDAITAELERAESLMCADCVQLVTNLLEDDRYEVREVAAWWFARRPALRDMLATQFVAELADGGTVAVRNAADFLGRTKTYTALPALRTAVTRGDLGADAKLAMVRAIKYMGHQDGNFVLVTAMADGSATVRAAAVNAWRDIRGQVSAAPVTARLTDASPTVRAEAATVVGSMGDAAGVPALEAMVLSDADPIARRNAAWALGKLGQASSRNALTIASTDTSGLVRMVARAALSTLN